MWERYTFVWKHLTVGAEEEMPGKLGGPGKTGFPEVKLTGLTF